MKFNPEINRIYVDSDGVLADFNSLAWEIFGEDPRAYEEQFGSEKFWNRIDDWFTWDESIMLDFFEALPLMPDAIELYDFLRPYKPIILTGSPRQIPDSHIQKQNWARRKFGEETPIITCLSKHKRTFCRPGDIIIDDWPKHRKLWEEVGGIWIHHDDTKSTIEKLKEHLND
jgi:hypothetical protein